jgi:hypothetical protein
MIKMIRNFIEGFFYSVFWDVDNIRRIINYFFDDSFIKIYNFRIK